MGRRRARRTWNMMEQLCSTFGALRSSLYTLRSSR